MASTWLDDHKERPYTLLRKAYVSYISRRLPNIDVAIAISLLTCDTCWDLCLYRFRAAVKDFLHPIVSENTLGIFIGKLDSPDNRCCRSGLEDLTQVSTSTPVSLLLMCTASDCIITVCTSRSMDTFLSPEVSVRPCIVLINITFNHIPCAIKWSSCSTIHSVSHRTALRAER